MREWTRRRPVLAVFTMALAVVLATLGVGATGSGEVDGRELRSAALLGAVTLLGTGAMAVVSLRRGPGLPRRTQVAAAVLLLFAAAGAAVLVQVV